jgi:RimJ/RimL family protein N-acetyltransferase
VSKRAARALRSGTTRKAVLVYDGRLVRLRAMEPEDAPTFKVWLNDPDVSEFLGVRYPISNTAEKEWIEAHSTVKFDNVAFAVETLAEGQLIGAVDLRVQEPETRRAELGISIGDKSVWGRGFGTDAVRTVCRFGFEQMNLHRIYLTVFAPNERAAATYRKAGFVEEGRAREDWYNRGAYVDVILMGLLRGELVED